ncbi:helix-turn-helix transcriptional regulator [Sphingomonas sp. MMS12-HWE2-04]|uniref:helix-turn-helix domain-containing protein n=1 Tax=Sphingomonas sp. MMS12-HWE2-04 TaxID=3234199 RepID=UPI0038500C66
MMMAGDGTREIAANLKIAPSTVRTHLIHLFQKTDTHSRADLLKLARTLSKPIV